MAEPVVVADRLSKSYQIYEDPADRIVELVTFRSRHRSFPALADVSFEVADGESLGVVGQNGAGKSTLLKLLAGVVKPTSGRLRTRGTVASILELGAGFHPEFSGRDNASLNAAILGLGPVELREKLPRIFEFSELGPFLDRPVRTYSSGMHMRLAFSVAVMVDPAVLIVDEALAVGDGHFQKKCVDRIRQLQRSGTTILFCSHSHYMVTTLCHRTLWLDAGRVKGLGNSADVVHEYEAFLLEKSRRVAQPSPKVAGIASDVTIEDIEVVDAAGARLETLRDRESLRVRARVRAVRSGVPFRLSVAVVRAADELRCCAVRTASDAPLDGPGSWEVEVDLHDLRLARGDYGVVVFAETPDGMMLLDRLDRLRAFRVGGSRWEVGVMRIGHEWIGTGLPPKGSSSA
ncbi:MAG: ABC transporter ATP-binding protein [Thermoanaerobaculia bacterium]